MEASNGHTGYGSVCPLTTVSYKNPKATALRLGTVWTKMEFMSGRRWHTNVKTKVDHMTRFLASSWHPATHLDCISLLQLLAFAQLSRKCTQATVQLSFWQMFIFHFWKNSFFYGNSYTAEKSDTALTSSRQGVYLSLALHKDWKQVKADHLGLPKSRSKGTSKANAKT